jgi:peptidoglycan/LPS O-acetylase OafA/YrhL
MEKSTIFQDTKKHYEILDALRGIAAILVIVFHLFEIFSGGDHAKQIINHGYLAVDFFFALSGFVIGYAYDDRWHKMTIIGNATKILIDSPLSKNYNWGEMHAAWFLRPIFFI